MSAELDVADYEGPPAFSRALRLMLIAFPNWHCAAPRSRSHRGSIAAPCTATCERPAATWRQCVVSCRDNAFKFIDLVSTDQSLLARVLDGCASAAAWVAEAANARCNPISWRSSCGPGRLRAFMRNKLMVGMGLLALGIGSAVWSLSSPAPQRARPAVLADGRAHSEQQQGSDSRSASAHQDEPHARSPGVAPALAAASTSPTVAARRAQRNRADDIRRQLAERTAAAAAAPGAAAEPSADSVTPTLSEAEKARRSEYMRRALQEQYVPVAKSCYEELLARQPRAQGKVVLAFSIVGDSDADAGGVVAEAELRDDSTMDDPEFVQCMRESLYSTVFEPPPRGASKTTIVYPIELSP